MNLNITNKNYEMVMALLHYFITEENYTPIVVRGVQDEIWLENLDAPYRIIRLNSNYIHNDEQYKFDMFKTKKVVEQIKKKTLSFHLETLNIFLNISDSVLLDNTKNISSIKVNDIKEIVNNENITDIFPKIKNKLIQDKEGIDLLVNVTNDINAKTVSYNETYTEIFKEKKSVITPILIGVCVLVFILMYIIGNGSEDVGTLLLFGANYKELVQSGQVWRLVTSIFLHIGIIHLIVNMYALWVIGHQMESFLGKLKYLIVFLGSGIIGSLLYFGYHYRLYLGTVLKTQVIPIIILNLIIGFTLPGIDNFGHIGGLVGGYLLTMALGIPGKSNKSDRINGIIVLTILVGFLIFMLWRG